MILSARFSAHVYLVYIYIEREKEKISLHVVANHGAVLLQASATGICPAAAQRQSP